MKIWRHISVVLILFAVVMSTLLPIVLSAQDDVRVDDGKTRMKISRGGREVYYLPREISDLFGEVNPNLLWQAARDERLDFKHLQFREGQLVDSHGHFYTITNEILSVSDSSLGFPVTQEYRAGETSLVPTTTYVGKNKVSPNLIRLLSPDSQFQIRRDLQNAKYDEGTGKIVTRDNRKIEFAEDTVTYYAPDGTKEDTIKFDGKVVVIKSPRDGSTLELKPDANNANKYIGIRTERDGSKKTIVYDQNLVARGFRDGAEDFVEFDRFYWPYLVRTQGKDAQINYLSAPGEVCDPTTDPYCISKSSNIEIVVNGVTYADFCRGRAGCLEFKDCKRDPVCNRALSEYGKANLGPGLDDAYRAASAASELFPQIENFAFIDTLFESGIGRFIRGEPSFGICEEYTKRASGQLGYIVADDDLFTLLAHIEGQKSVITTHNDTQIFYYVTWQINAHEDVTYNVDFMIGDSIAVSLFVQDEKVKAGEQVAFTGQNAIAQYSRRSYDRLCLRMSAGVTCNKFTDVGSIPLVPTITREEASPVVSTGVPNAPRRRFNTI